MERGKVLLVEDEPLVVADMVSILENLGFDVPVKASSGEEALALMYSCPFDIALVDIELGGKMTGLEIAPHLQVAGMVVIYLTRFSGEEWVKKASQTRPFAYLTKPVNESTLSHTLLLALALSEQDAVHSGQIKTSFSADSFFVKAKNEYRKVKYKDVLWVRAERVYCHLGVCVESPAGYQEELLTHPSSKLEQLLPKEQFMRIHRSYLVNLTAITRVGPKHVVICGKEIPVGETFQAALEEKLQFLK